MKAASKGLCRRVNKRAHRTPSKRNPATLETQTIPLKRSTTVPTKSISMARTHVQSADAPKAPQRETRPLDTWIE